MSARILLRGFVVALLVALIVAGVASLFVIQVDWWGMGPAPLVGYLALALMGGVVAFLVGVVIWVIAVVLWNLSGDVLTRMEARFGRVQ